jgi:hypothetical protein
MTNNKNFYLFLTSLIIGLLILGFDIFYSQSDKSFSNNNAIAKVNDQYINEDQFLKYAVTLGADFKADKDQELINLVLERMIEEELLVQRAIELKLHQQDIQVRKVLIEQIIEFILQLNNSNPSDDILQNYFKDNIGRYKSEVEFKIDAIFIKSQSQDSAMLGSDYDLQLHQDKLDTIQNYINTNGFKSAKKLFSNSQFLPIPEQLMKYKDCVKYLGPSNCKNIKEMSSGSISEPIFYNNGFYILQMNELKQTQINETNFSDFKEQVLFDYKNYQDDQSFLEYIDFLKSRASITKYELE